MTEKQLVPRSEAEKDFFDAILSDVPALPEQEVYRPFGGLYGRTFGTTNSVQEGPSPFSTKAPMLRKDEQVVTLQPYKGPLHGRLDRQAVELRKRLSNPKAVMLVMQGRTYSAESVWGAVWLFLKTKLFKRWTKKSYPSLAI